MIMTIFALLLVGAKLIMQVAAATVIAVSGMMSQVTAAIAAGFSGTYNPTNWTFLNTGGSTNGYVNPTGAPSSILLVGGNSGSYTFGETNYTIAVAGDGTWSFDWSYSNAGSPGFDIGGYTINGSNYYLTDSSFDSGSVSISVYSGDVIGFQVQSFDNYTAGAPGFLTISNFLAPEAVPYEFSPGLGLLLLGVGWGAVNLCQFVKKPRSFVNLQALSNDEEDKAA